VRDAEGLRILPDLTHGRPGDRGETFLVEAIVMPGSMLEGSTLASSTFRQRYNATVLCMKKRERLFRRRMGSVSLDQGDTLLLSATREAIQGLKRDPDFIVAEELEAEAFRHEKIPLVLAILVGVIGTAWLGWLTLATAAVSGMILLVFTGCLPVGELHESIRWDICSCWPASSPSAWPWTTRERLRASRLDDHADDGPTPTGDAGHLRRADGRDDPDLEQRQPRPHAPDRRRRPSSCP